MKNIALLLISIMILMNCSGASEKTVAHERPNIIFVLVDDLGKEWISCYGAEDIETPNIDALAKSGTLFNNVYGMPQCTPTRVTLLTGQYPFRHGWVNHWDVPRWGGGAHYDETLNPSLFAEMKKAGYSTCIAGKWQIDDFRVEPDALIRNGFDAWCMWTGYEAGNPEPSGNRYHDPYLFTKEGSRTYSDKYGPEVFKDFICDFIKENKDDPMFIYFPMALTHTPLHNPPNDISTDKMGKHRAMVKYTDQLMGEIVQILEEVGIRDKTLIIWTTDNGTSGGISGTLNGRKVKGGKSKTSEAGICLPFIASWPSVIPADQSSNELIDFTDLFPTCLELAGIDVGKEYKIGNHNHTIDGMSFKEVLTKNGKSSREWILGMGGGNNARLTEKGVENQYVFRDRVVRNKRFKLYINAKRQAEQFYDLLVDPSENANLIDSLSTDLRNDNFNALKKVIASFPKQDRDPIYEPNPDQEWDVEVTAKSQVWKM